MVRVPGTLLEGGLYILALLQTSQYGFLGGDDESTWLQVSMLRPFSCHVEDHFRQEMELKVQVARVQSENHQGKGQLLQDGDWHPAPSFSLCPLFYELTLGLASRVAFESRFTSGAALNFKIMVLKGSLRDSLEGPPLLGRKTTEAFEVIVFAASPKAPDDSVFLRSFA